MNKVKSQHIISNEFLHLHPDFESQIPFDLVKEFSNYLISKGLLTLTTTKEMANTKFELEGFILKRSEQLEAIKLIRYLKHHVSATGIDELESLFNILTK